MLKNEKFQPLLVIVFFQIDGLQKAQMRLINKIILNTPSLLTMYFSLYAGFEEHKYTDYRAAKVAIEKGEKALDRKNYDELKNALLQLISLANHIVSFDKISGTGLG